MRALTLGELILLNLLREREAERNVVAKLHGLTRFAKGIAQLNADGDEMADAVERLLARKDASKTAFLNAVANANAAFDTVDELTAAFGGNGGPPLSDSPAPAQPSPQPDPGEKPSVAGAAAPAATGLTDRSKQTWVQSVSQRG